jgi:hypothetical protein
VCTVDWGKVIDAVSAAGSVLAAIGAFVAAYFALKIAGQARADARRESDEAHEAQARLVRISIDGVEPQRAFAVEVANWGSLAILNVALVTASFESTYRPPDQTPQPVLKTQSRSIDVLVPVSREALAQPRFVVDFQVGGQTVLERHGDVGYDPLNSDNTTVRATVEFTDAYGLHWQQSTDGTPKRIPNRSTVTLHTAP